MKMAKAVGVMYEIGNKVDNHILIMLCYTLILPHLKYCNDIWGNTYYSRMHKLALLQKRVIRIIGNAGHRKYTKIIFQKIKILKLKDLIKLQTCILMYKANKLCKK